MVTIAERERRYAKLRGAMKELGYHVVIALSTNDEGERGYLRYLTGHHIYSRWGYAILTQDWDPILVMIAKSQQHWARVMGWCQDIRMAPDPITGVKDVLNELAVKEGRVGIAGLNAAMRITDYLYLKEAFPKLQFEDAGEVFARAMAVKSGGEIADFRESMAIADAAIRTFEGHLRPGARVCALIGEVEKTQRTLGVVDTLNLLSTTAQLNPYLNRPVDRVVEAGDLVIFSVELAGPGGYWVERAEMFSLGEPGEQVRRQFASCKEAMEQGVALLKPGSSPGVGGAYIEDRIKNDGFNIGIWSGHGIGLDIIEQPLVGRGAPGQIQENMIIAVHPHVISQDGKVGVYISDTFLITPTGGVSPTTLPYQLRIVT
ncbi:MAG: aminopeptidase P family protein [Chloroflexi bacterium]|nr:aminopeptidase P family protein [Chloroflexota bacterium]